MTFLGVMQNLLSIEVGIAILIGTVGGIIVGALPGLSAAMAVALLIPVTFGMSPVAGLVMLTALYTSAIYGGSITATLIHTPGTPASAATAIDGYELTKQGKGMKALGVSTISSMIGGTISAFALLFLSPPLAQVSLKFSAPEYFLMALFGLSIIGSLAGDSMIKGVMSGLLGLLVGIVGLDQVIGVQRFTFGIINLESGVSLVPAMIGMFSISQVMISVEQIAKGKSSILEDPSSMLTGSILPTWEEFKMISPTILRSSLIGVIIGILPGAGGEIGSWIGYNEAKRFAKKPELFGRGSIEGVAASESANNAVTGGALIPLLTLGIPGSSVAAILLGGLMIQGLLPGYDLFTKSADVTYSIIIGFIIANILMGVIGLAIARHVVKVSLVPMTILCPVIVALSSIGAFAISNSIVDLYVMLVFGLLGYFMRKTGFGTAPVILGMILATMLEANFTRSIILSKGNLLQYYLSRPISIFLSVLVVLSLLAPIFVNRLNKKINNQVPLEDAEAN